MTNHPNRSKKCRPREHLRTASKLYPDAWKQIDLARSLRGTKLPNWPDWCFCPLAASFAIVSGGGQMPPSLVTDVGRVGGLAAWRMTQSIYRFDPALYYRLIETPIDRMPVDTLYRLPEWCVYIETPDLTPVIDLEKGFRIHGFFAHLEWDATTEERPELRLLFDIDVNHQPDLMPAPLHLDQDTLGEALQAAHEESLRYVDPERADEIRALGPGSSRDYAPFISLLLYLCSDHPDFGDRKPPKNPQPKKTRRMGWRLFPAPGPRTWDVGVRIGSALRDAEHRAQSNPPGQLGESGRARPRAHVRRAHWHSFWTGPRDSDQELLVRWIPPVPINIDKGDDLPVTVKPVKESE